MLDQWTPQWPNSPDYNVAYALPPNRVRPDSDLELSPSLSRTMHGTGSYNGMGTAPTSAGGGQLVAVFSLHPQWLLARYPLIADDYAKLETAAAELSRFLYLGGMGRLRDTVRTGSAYQGVAYTTKSWSCWVRSMQWSNPDSAGARRLLTVTFGGGSPFWTTDGGALIPLF